MPTSQKRFRYTCASALFALVLPCALAQAAAPVGLLSKVSGTVQIVRAGEKSTHLARTADLILPGDRIIVATNSEASFLFCPEAVSARILEESEIEFDSPLEVHKGKVTDERKVGSCQLPDNLSATSEMPFGMLRLRPSNLVLVSPFRTSIATPRPHFRWEPLDRASGYLIDLLDHEQRVLWSDTVNTNHAVYSASAPALQWGQKYWWRITASDGQRILSEASASFQLLPQEQAERVRWSEESLRRMITEHPGDNAALFLIAFLYEQNGLFDQAVLAYAELAHRIGPQNWVEARLVNLMNNLGWEKLYTDLIQ
ncbi:MAG: hypothetical protein HYX72_02735 [Acidobacteria bacterium]|nr:hypothetical protein [Acidobacteriota bacterium]